MMTTTLTLTAATAAPHCGVGGGAMVVGGGSLVRTRWSNWLVRLWGWWKTQARLGCYVTAGLGGGVVVDKAGGGDWRWVQQWCWWQLANGGRKLLAMAHSPFSPFLWMVVLYRGYYTCYWLKILSWAGCFASWRWCVVYVSILCFNGEPKVFDRCLVWFGFLALYLFSLSFFICREKKKIYLVWVGDFGFLYWLGKKALILRKSPPSLFHPFAPCLLQPPIVHSFASVSNPDKNRFMWVSEP